MGTWQQWLTAFRRVGMTADDRRLSAMTYRQLAAGVEFLLRVLDDRHLLPDVPNERPVIVDLSWPSSLSVDDRVAFQDRFPPLGVQTTTATWMSTVAKVLDDHKITVGDWSSFKATADGVADLTRRAARPAPVPVPPPPPRPAPAPAGGAGPWGRFVRGMQPPIEQWTREAALEVLYWLLQQHRAARIPVNDRSYLWDIIRSRETNANPDSPVPPTLIPLLRAQINVDADELDAADAPLRPYQAIEVWDESPWSDDDGVQPGTVNTDLPPRPQPGPQPAPGGGAAPAGGVVPGPYVLAYNRFATWAAQSNGLATDKVTPRLTREQGAAVMRYAVRMARQSFNRGDAVTTAWLPIALALLGWRQRGDVYRMDAPWRTGWTPLPTIAELWAYVLTVCKRLDAAGVAFEGPHPSPTADYQVMAQEARDAQIADDPTMAPPVGPSGGADANGVLPPLPGQPDIIVRPGGSSRNADGGALLIALAFLLAEGA